MLDDSGSLISLKQHGNAYASMLTLVATLLRHALIVNTFHKTVAILPMVALLALAGCSEPPLVREKITVATPKQVFSAAMYVAIEKGYLSEEGLDVTIEDCILGREALESLIAGRSDIGFAAETPVTRCILKDPAMPLRIHATVSSSDSQLMLLADKAVIPSTADLRGKRIGVVAGTNMEFFFHLIMIVNRLDPATVTIVPVTDRDMLPALKERRLDGVVCWPPVSYDIEKWLGKAKFSSTGDELYRFNWNVVASESLKKSRPGTMLKFLRALDKANVFMRNNPGQAAAITSRYLDSPADLVERSIGEIEFKMGIDQSLVLSMEAQARWIVADDKAAAATPNMLTYFDVESLSVLRPDSISISGLGQ
jgi:ABC-type nitrate/sulfonate/bicarbonate transport system substrate-binding protein